MACALTAGYVRDCDEAVGGLKAARVIETKNILEVTEAAGIVTGITKVATKRFWHIEQPKETGYAKDTLTKNTPNGSLYYAQELMLAFNGMQTNTRTMLATMAKTSLTFVVKDNNEKYWLVGRNNGLDATGGEHGTGTAFGDRNGATMTFGGGEKEMMIEVSEEVWESLETPGA